MTTIAYRDGVMAADSRKTHRGTYHDKTVKMFLDESNPTQRASIAVAGRLSSYQHLLRWMTRHGSLYTSDLVVPKTDLFDNTDGHTDALLWLPDQGTLFVLADHAFVGLDAPYAAIGSGMDYALGAMAMGADAVKAVEVAAQFDVYTGGEIRRLQALPHNTKIEGEV